MAPTDSAIWLAAPLLLAALVGGALGADEAAIRALKEEMARDAARSDEAKRQAEENLRQIQPPIHREPARPPAKPSPLPGQMFADGVRLEREGRTRDAVKAYVAAARAGSGKAAVRLAEIYETGVPGVARDLDYSRLWSDFARLLGEDVPRRPIPQ